VTQRTGSVHAGSHSGRHRAAAPAAVVTDHRTTKNHAAPRGNGHVIVAAAAAAMLVPAGLVGIQLLDDPAPSTPGPGTGPTSAPTSAPGTSAGKRPDPGTTAVSRVMTVRLGRDRKLRVEETVIPDPPGRLDLSVPDTSGVLVNFEPTIRNLRVLVGGRPQRLVRALSTGDSITVRLPREAPDVRLEYTVTGAVRNSEPSVPGRALALMTPLSVAHATGGWSVEVVAAEVRNVGCVDASGSMLSCGTRSGRRWTVEDTGAGAVPDVVAQLDLAAAGPRGLRTDEPPLR
jgi:hypothetical protein